MRRLNRGIVLGAERRMCEIERLSADPRAAAEKFVRRFLTPSSTTLPMGSRARHVSEAAARLRALRDLDALFALLAAAPQDDFLDGRWLDVGALLDPWAPLPPGENWFDRRGTGRPSTDEPFAHWLERTATEIADLDVRYLSGPAHVLTALLNIVARRRAAALESPSWARLAAIQLSDGVRARYAPLLRVHLRHPVRVVEALRVPRLGTIAIGAPTDDLMLLLDRGLAFELAHFEPAAKRIALWESEAGATYELVVSSPADGLFDVQTGVTLRCTSRSPLTFARLVSTLATATEPTR